MAKLDSLALDWYSYWDQPPLLQQRNDTHIDTDLATASASAQTINVDIQRLVALLILFQYLFHLLTYHHSRLYISRMVNQPMQIYSGAPETLV